MHVHDEESWEVCTRQCCMYIMVKKFCAKNCANCMELCELSNVPSLEGFQGYNREQV